MNSSKWTHSVYVYGRWAGDKNRGKKNTRRNADSNHSTALLLLLLLRSPSIATSAAAVDINRRRGTLCALWNPLQSAHTECISIWQAYYKRWPSSLSLSLCCAAPPSLLFSPTASRRNKKKKKRGWWWRIIESRNRPDERLLTRVKRGSALFLAVCGKKATSAADTTAIEWRADYRTTSPEVKRLRRFIKYPIFPTIHPPPLRHVYSHFQTLITGNTIIILFFFAKNMRWWGGHETFQKTFARRGLPSF